LSAKKDADVKLKINEMKKFLTLWVGVIFALCVSFSSCGNSISITTPKEDAAKIGEMYTKRAKLLKSGDLQRADKLEQEIQERVETMVFLYSSQNRDAEARQFVKLVGEELVKSIRELK
jgi:outer membrane protein assembly factor BamD (BamD/ComL family)